MKFECINKILFIIEFIYFDRQRLNNSHNCDITALFIAHIRHTYQIMRLTLDAFSREVYFRV